MQNYGVVVSNNEGDRSVVDVIQAGFAIADAEAAAFGGFIGLSA